MKAMRGASQWRIKDIMKGASNIRRLLKVVDLMRYSKRKSLKSMRRF